MTQILDLFKHVLLIESVEMLCYVHVHASCKCGVTSGDLIYRYMHQA